MKEREREIHVSYDKFISGYFISLAVPACLEFYTSVIRTCANFFILFLDFLGKVVVDCLLGE